MTGDFDGDGKGDFIVVKSPNAAWYILKSSGGWDAPWWGVVGDRTVAGDYNGDGKTDLGIWRANEATFWIFISGGTYYTMSWGLGTDVPVPADYDGDGKTDIAVWRPSNGGWFVIKSSDNAFLGQTNGSPTDVPIPAPEVGYIASSNQPPVANAGSSYTASVGKPARFDGTGSTDADGLIYSYLWDFGDGLTAQGPRPTHTYSSDGLFTVTLTVRDNLGASSSTTTTAFVVNDIEARLDPFNNVGTTDPISRNFNWSTNLVQLPGRAGLDLGLSLSYNSLVWLKQARNGNDFIVFDPDLGFPGPGFRFGLPQLEINAQDHTRAILISGSGKRIEFRLNQTVGNVYESTDSSFAQITSAGGNLLMRTTDGTQYLFQRIGERYECVQIKDRNGNFIEASYNSFGRLAQIVDTLGRMIVIDYDANGNPLSVAQSTPAGPRVYATFGYETLTVDANFPNMHRAGPANGAGITVLKQVGLDDGSYHRFNYNPFGQIYQVESFAADNHKLNHVKYNLQSPGAQADCPRFTQREDYAENWMTVATSYTVPAAASWTMPDTGQSETGMVSKVTAPDGTENHYYYSDSGWKKGIPRLTETWGRDNTGAPFERQRWNTVHLVQDNPNLSYIENPRPTSIAVGDGGNIRKSSMLYGTLTLPSGTSVSLLNDLIEYAADGTTVYRHTQTDYNFGSEYVGRHMIGLVSESRLYEGTGTGTLKAKTTYGYDEESVSGLTSVIRQDSANYGPAFQWRGNNTSVRRWDATSPTDIAFSTVNRVGYDQAGNIVWTQDPVQSAAQRTQISYADNYSDGVNRNTYGFATTVTDPEGYIATTKYHYLSGLVDEVQGPKAGQTDNAVRGFIDKTHYDTIDRISKKETLTPSGQPTGAYTRYNFPLSMTVIEAYTKLDNSLGESFQFFAVDGHGRKRATASELPGSTGGYSGTVFLYDSMGRNWKTSKSAETTASGDLNGWDTTGDDDLTGWLYVTESFDWKGRTTVITDNDGTTRESVYDGCGCAGGEIVTIKDEANRTQKNYHDVLGRLAKRQIWYRNAQNVDAVYATTVNAYNVSDQVTNVKIYSGEDPSNNSCPLGTCQETTIDYDGHGRSWRIHQAEQRDSSDNWKYSIVAYNPDDTVQSMTDARGVTRRMFYTPRKLLQRTEFDPIAGVEGLAPIQFQYDAMGNRTRMDDSLGFALYEYDDRSRMSAEVRSFNSSSWSGSVRIEYDYLAGGDVTAVSLPGWGGYLNTHYSYDKVGRLKTISNGGWSTAFSAITNIDYRASGAAKRISYGNGLTATIDFNNRMQPSRYELKNASNQLLMGHSYEYTSTPTSNDNDGLLKRSVDLSPLNFNRTYSYDHLKRRISATSSVGVQTFGYNAFGNLTNCDGCRLTSNSSYSETPVNNRNTQAGWFYDNDGRLIESRNSVTNERTLLDYDVAGQLRRTRILNSSGQILKDLREEVDGDGNVIIDTDGGQRTFHLRSSVLGRQTLLDLNHVGALKVGYFLNPSGGVIARQDENFRSIHKDPSGVSNRETDHTGAVTSNVETDPLGTQINGSGGSVGGGGVGFYLPPGYAASFSIERRLMERTAEYFRMMASWSFWNVSSSSTQTTQTGIAVGLTATTPNDASGNVGPMGPTEWGPPQTWTRATSSFALSMSMAYSYNSVTFFTRMSCQDALNQAGKTQEGLQRAQAALSQLEQIVGDANMAKLLAAIGIQESNFLNVKQIGGGPGRGIFQIEPRAYKITEAQAMDMSDAAKAIADTWGKQWADIGTAMGNAGYDMSKIGAQYWALAGLARIHNRWRPGVVRSDKKGNLTIGSLLASGLKSLNMGDLDNPGRKIDKRLDETARGTYVRNVMDIFFSCFNTL